MKTRFTEKFSSLLRREEGDASRGSFSRAAFALFFLCGIFAGYCLCSVAESALMSAALEADLAAARAASGRAPSFANAGRTGGAEEFALVNPFRADRRAGTDAEKAKAEQAAQGAALLSSLTLRGTLPGVGAWIEGKEGVKLVLVGQDVDGYTLSGVSYAEASLSDGSRDHAIYLILSGGERPAQTNTRQNRRARRAAPRQPARREAPKSQLDFSGLEPASEGREGAVPRELVDALLMNPYDELAKVRMIPTPDSSGMKLESLAPDSVLARVGVAQGDVISAINGVNISNVADASNALNSLMAGTRFDVTVLRGGKPVELKYQVK